MIHPSSDRPEGLPFIEQMTSEKVLLKDFDRIKLPIKKVRSSCSDPPRKDLKKDYNSLEYLSKNIISNPEKCINQITEDDFRIFNSGSNNGVNLNVYRKDFTCPMCLRYNGSTTTCLSSLYLLYLNPYLGSCCGLCTSGKYFSSRLSSNLFNTGNEPSLPASSLHNTGCKSACTEPCLATIFTRILLLIAVLTSFNTSLVYGMSPPPNYSQSLMPDSNFTCTDKATGGYYADPEAFCQMFHVCVRISDEEMKDFRFLCPHDTVFDQQNFICTNWWEIDCERSTRYYNKNDLFKEDGGNITDYDYENPESPGYYEYVYEYVEPESTTKEQAPPVIIPPDPPDNRHRLKLGKSTQHGMNRQGKSESIDTSSIRSTSLAPVTAKSTPGLSTLTKQQPVIITTVKNSTSTTLSLTDTTTTPIITTHRPESHFSFQPVSPVGRTTAAPSIILNSRGRPRERPEHRANLRYNPDDEDQNLNLDSEDPFSIYDWRRDSTGVTASARTRYEALFGGTSSRGRQNTDVREDGGTNEKDLSVNPASDVLALSPPEKRPRHSSLRKLPEEVTTQTPRNAPADTRHKEFSNFRFYKTAFGRSYSSDDYFGPTSATSAKPIQVSDRAVRPERTASRNTRYSIYA